MDPNQILAHIRLNDGLAAVHTANEYLEAKRPLKEVLGWIDQGIAGLHDSRAELVRWRENVYLQMKEENADHTVVPFPEAHESSQS